MFITYTVHLIGFGVRVFRVQIIKRMDPLLM